ncbi:MAG TPA: beta-propeller domain-containing protein [Patescibacteria group bacterium]|nr:beta-propeller domain-containing protein [Patescibacteria group bacterium]
MQKEIAKRARFYGVAAILLAIVLVSMCYQLGYLPQIPNSTTSAMATFVSFEELHDFLKKNSQPQGWYVYKDALGGATVFLSPATRGPQALMEGNTQFSEVISDLQHSTTNVQVTGVDEADSVKTDDHGYIYLITGNNITILKGYPPEEAEIVSVIAFTDISPVGIFVDGDRLAVLGSKYNSVQTTYYDVRWSYFTDVSTYAKIYEVSNRSEPELLTTYTTSGSYFNSRMIGEYVYFVSSTPAYYTLDALPGLLIDKVNLPKIESNGNSREVSPMDIHYSNVTDNYYMFTTIVAMNVQNITEEPNHKTIMTGGASAMYVSMNNVYISYPGADKTSLYRIRIEGSTISPEAQGEVPGSILNQFSMDEHNDYFRIATTTWEGTQKNNVYVFNMNLTMVGNLSGLAPGEHIYSARFMGNKCYLVTFVSIDPLFVIDLSDPANPAVLGELKIPGYSDYLHPYDENHLIGVGKHTIEADQDFFAWYQGVKIALFDVSNVSNPVQIANYTIGDRGSDSPVLRDHKAFLFDRQRNLLVIPALVAEIDPSEYPSEIPPYAYGKPVWQGAMVFNVTLEKGFELRGGITHVENAAEQPDWNHYVQRSFYIENMLYTISTAKVKMNNLEDLTLIKEIRVG